MNKWRICALIAISGVVVCPGAHCVENPNFVDRAELKLLDEQTGQYLGDGERTRLTNNMHGQRDVRIKVTCDNNRFLLAPHDDRHINGEVTFSITIGRQDLPGTVIRGPDETVRVANEDREIWLRVDLPPQSRGIINANPGVEFSANLTITREAAGA